MEVERHNLPVCQSDLKIRSALLQPRNHNYTILRADGATRRNVIAYVSSFKRASLLKRKEPRDRQGERGREREERRADEAHKERSGCKEAQRCEKQTGSVVEDY